ncbi:MAG: hypothetical protein ACI9HK_001009 [Pirellulaceae bacterium]|jgi:hypothetical protein
MVARRVEHAGLKFGWIAAGIDPHGAGHGGNRKSVFVEGVIAETQEIQ